VESLHDGIPDQWKKNNGLSTTDLALYNKIDAKTGYTYLEDYLAGNTTVTQPPATPAPAGPATPSEGGATAKPVVPVASNSDCAPQACGNVFNNTLYQQSAAGNWWAWNGSAWKKVGGDPRSAAPTQ
jgi:hypothetical protein